MNKKSIKLKQKKQSENLQGTAYKPVSLRKKVIGPQIIFLAVQLTILLFCFLGLGILNNARDNEITKLSASVGSRAIQVQKYFNNISINASYAASKIQADMQNVIGSPRSSSVSEFIKNKESLEKFQSAAMPDLINALEYSGTSGAFIILNTDNGSGSNAALYLRDSQPQTVSSKDMLFLRGPYLIARDYSIPLDSEWRYGQALSDNSDNSFYFEPFRAAQNSNTNKTDQFGYWSSLFELPSSNQNMITYTLPLVDSNGKPYGVFGFELSESLLAKSLPPGEIPYANGVYVLYKESDPNSLPQYSFFSGAFASILNSTQNQIHPAGFGNSSLLSINSGNLALLGIKTSLELYSPASSFAREKWALIGMVPQNELLAVWYTTLQILVIAFSLALIIGLAGIFRSGRVFAGPISALAKKIRAANPKEPVLLGRTSIAEIDDLTAALEKMSRDVAQAASRLSKIIGLVGLPLGGYEADFHNGMVYCTDSMLDLFAIRGELPKNTVPLTVWQMLLTDILNDKEEGFEDVYRYNPTLQNVRWLRIKKTSISPQMELGIVLDVTNEVIHKRQSDFERDYDQVTGFMTRKAFLFKCTEIIEADPNSSGILLLSDLYYIHRFEPSGELENEALRQAAGCFGQFRRFGGILARISDYEFAVYIHHYASIKDVLDFSRNLFSTPLKLKRMDGLSYEFFFSVGAGLYPEDAKKAEDLLTLADFAQNEAKKLPQKGVKKFDIESYNQNNSMDQKYLALGSILSSGILGIFLSPIINANSGIVMGYDALMDYQSNLIQKTEDMLYLARMSSRLFELEKLSLLSLLSYMQQNLNKITGSKIFFTSLTNEIIPQEEIKRVDSAFSELSPLLVFNLSDTEHSDKQIFILKNNELKKRGIAIAIDHYGTTSASELLLLDLNPAFLRLDSSITQDVDLDPNRHQLLLALLSYTTTRNIKTIATGIRTGGELETLIKMGIDYVSGPYLCGPVAQAITPDSDIAQTILNKVKAVSTYRFILEDGEERFSRVIKEIPSGMALTEREKDILMQLCRGELNNVISSQLGISSNTLKTHIRNIYSKCGVRNRRELLLLTESTGRVDSELSLREKEILRLIIQGKTNQEITHSLCISNNTVRVHIWNICTKLGVKNRKELMDIYL